MLDFLSSNDVYNITALFQFNKSLKYASIMSATPAVPNMLQFSNWVLIIFSLIFLVSLNFIYNAFFHPLRSYPGPWYTGISRLWHVTRSLKGTLPYDVKKLHDRYGFVVRIAPDELSYNCPDAWQEIYGRNTKPGSTVKQLFRKDPVFYASFVDNQGTLIDAEDDLYKNQKKPMSYGFSQNAIASTQEIITKYHVLMIEALKGYMKTHKEAIDMNTWVSNCSFDIATMLTISHEQGALAKKETIHPALVTMTTSIGFLYAYLQIQRLPKPITWTLNKFTLFVFGKFKLFERNNSSAPLFEDRLKNGSQRPDYMTHLLKSTDPRDSSLVPRATFLIIAGTETTSTAILGTIFHLTANPQTYQLAAHEIRSAFKDASEINIDSTRDLPYLSACVNESLRMYSPTPGTFPRVIPPGGAVISGRYVPVDTIVGVTQYATFRSNKNFSRPDEFLPERWLEADSTDKREAFHPFSMGPRICIAREFALADIKQMMAHLLWEFDMDLVEECRNWSTQTTGVTPHRGQLLINVTCRGV